MIDTLLSTIAPHLCYNCGEIGAVLCDNCKYDIIEENIDRCIICNKISQHGACDTCKAPFTRSWFIGERKGMLKKLVDDYKFENVKAAHSDLAALLSLTIGQLPAGVVVTSVPTIASHVRQRGYDHAALLAKTLARLQRVPYQPTLLRRTNTVQREAAKQVRMEQARQAFLPGGVIKDQVYLLVDDIYTTGATFEYASRTLLEGGASEVWVAVLCVQPLD